MSSDSKTLIIINPAIKYVVIYLNSMTCSKLNITQE